MKHVTILFADLDGTLIDTISGSTFPKGIWDMSPKLYVWDKIKELQPECVCIVSNQGGIEKGFVDEENFKKKAEYIIRSMTEYTGVRTIIHYCRSNDPKDDLRKPNTGMLTNSIHRSVRFMGIDDNKAGMLMIGDASGKEGQFSDSDLKTAQNFGIDYLDVNDFVRNVGCEK